MMRQSRQELVKYDIRKFRQGRAFQEEIFQGFIGSGYLLSQKINTKRGSALTENQEDILQSQPSESSIESPLKTANIIPSIKEHITAIFHQPIQVHPPINVPNCFPKIHMQPIGQQTTSYFINSNAKVASCKGNYIMIGNSSLQNDSDIVDEEYQLQQQIQQVKRMRCHSPQERLKAILYESQEMQDTSIKAFTRRKSCKGGSIFGEDTYLMSQRERLFPLAIINMHVKRIILLSSKKLKDSQKKTQVNFWKETSKTTPLSSKNFTGNKSLFNNINQHQQSSALQFAHARALSISQHPLSPLNQRQGKLANQGQALNPSTPVSITTFSSTFKTSQVCEAKQRASMNASPSMRSKSNSLSENFSNFQGPDFADNNIFEIPAKGSKTPLSRISKMSSQEKQTRDNLLSMVKEKALNGKKNFVEQQVIQENSKINEIRLESQGQHELVDTGVLHKDEGGQTVNGDNQKNILESKEHSHQEAIQDHNILSPTIKVRSPNSSFVSRRSHIGQNINPQILRINKITKAEQDRRGSSIQIGSQIRIASSTNPNSPTQEKRKFSLNSLSQSSHKTKPDQNHLSSFYSEQHNKHKSQEHNMNHLDPNNSSTIISNQMAQLQQEQGQGLKQLSKMRKVFVTATNKITEQNKTNASNTFYKSYYNLVGKISLNAEITQIPTLSDEICSTPKSHRKERKSAPMLKKNKPSFSPRKCFQAKVMFINSINKFKLNSTVQRYVGDKSRDHQLETSFLKQQSFESNPLMEVNKQKQQLHTFSTSPSGITPLPYVDMDELSCKLSEEQRQPASELKIQENNVLKNCFYQQTKNPNHPVMGMKNHSRNKSSQLMGENKNNSNNNSLSFNFHETVNRRWHNMSSIINGNFNTKPDNPISLQNSRTTLGPYINKTSQANLLKRAASPYLLPISNSTHKGEYLKNLNSKKQPEQQTSIHWHKASSASGKEQKKNISMSPFSNHSQKLDIL